VTDYNYSEKRKLSKIDKAIIKIILKNEMGVETPKDFAILNIPRTTFNRRLKYLKKNHVRTYTDLDQKGLDFRRVDLLISTSHDAKKIGKELLKREEVIVVVSRIGEHDVDLRVEVIIKDNAELLDLINTIKSTDGVRDIRWSEIVETIGRKKSVPDSIIDRL
jgi:DNA-binding Lrp family transcriptional regulator